MNMHECDFVPLICAPPRVGLDMVHYQYNGIWKAASQAFAAAEGFLCSLCLFLSHSL